MERALLRVRLKEQLYVEVEMLERLMCAVFGHKYVVEREFVGARKVGCTRCLMKWGMHDGTRSSVPWDGELEAFYSPAAEHGLDARTAVRQWRQLATDAAQVIGILRSKIKALESEILEQCRINGMGAEREAALLGKVAQRSAALKMAREALEQSSKRDIAQWHNYDIDGDDDGKAPEQLNDPVLQAQLKALAAINALGENNG